MISLPKIASRVLSLLGNYNEVAAFGFYATIPCGAVAAVILPPGRFGPAQTELLASAATQSAHRHFRANLDFGVTTFANMLRPRIIPARSYSVQETHRARALPAALTDQE